MEYWNIGILGYWDIEILGYSDRQLNGHYANIPELVRFPYKSQVADTIQLFFQQ
jgi:hypothetical protein